MMRKTFKTAALSLLLASAPAFALQSDSKQPIQIEADQGSLDQGNRSTADGSPVKFSQTLDDNQGVVNGQANNAEYSSATGIVKLTGNAKVQRGGDVAQGAVITYNMRTEVYNIIGGGKSSAKAGTKSGRVSVVIQPSSTQKK